MKFRIAAAALFLSLALAAAASAQQTSVEYRLYHYEGGSWVEYSPSAALPAGGDQPGTNLWRYTYELCNVSFSSGVRELDVFFNSDNVACAALSGAAGPADWTATQVGPFAPDNNWRERFRTLLTAARVGMGACEPAFSVDFLWTCPGLPGPQNYDAISSTGSDARTTVPASPTPVQATTWGRVKDLYRP